MYPEEALMCSRYGGHLSHLGWSLWAVGLLETLQKLRKGSSRWRQVQTGNDSPVA